MTPAGTAPIAACAALLLLLLLPPPPAAAHPGPLRAPHRAHPGVRRIVRVREPWRIADCADGARIRARAPVSVCRRHGGFIGWED